MAGQSIAATTTTGGPYIDFKGYLGTDNVNPVGINTSSTWTTVWGSPYMAPTWGAPASIFPYPHDVGTYGGVVNTFNDVITLGNGPVDPSMAYMAAAQYITYDNTSSASSMTVTTIYGVDTAPSSSTTLILTGYNLSAVYPSLSDEHIIGPSGTTYSAGPGELVKISDLGARLGTTFDLAPFTGDPTASVYVFQTTVPFSEALIPEPGSSTLLGCSAIAGLVFWRRRKTA